MTLSIQQLASLRKQGITVLIEYGNSSVKCATDRGPRIYTADDLKKIAKPGCFDRFTAMIKKGAI